VLVHRQYLSIWNDLPGRVGLANAQQFWDHVAMTPGQPPKGRHLQHDERQARRTQVARLLQDDPLRDHRRGRIDYQFNPSATDGARRDPHGVVKILTVDLGSH